MSPRTEKQFEKIRQDKKKLIMTTALDLFSHNGYHNTPISKIAKEANISKGLLYNYFESKEELLRQIVFDGVDQIFKDFDPNHDGQLTNKEFSHYIRNIFKSIQENKTFWKMFYALLFQHEIMSIFEQEIGGMINQFASILLTYFKEQGYEDPEMETYLFSATIEGALLIYITGTDFIPLDNIADGIIKKYTHH